MSAKSKIVIPFLVFFLWHALVFAQVPTFEGIQSVSISGELRGELQYDNITGKDQGRPKWIHTLLFTPTISFPGLPALDFQLKFSSLDESIRQPFNRFSLHTNWNWGDFYLGDAYPVFSKHSLNGILVRGFNVDIQPGLFRLAVSVGYTKRAIEGTEGATPSFTQILYGIKIGYGQKNGSRLNLNLVKVKDDAASIQSPGTKTPQDNVVIGLDGALHLFEGGLILSGEIAGSAFSRDLRSREVATPVWVPPFATKLFPPRLSSQYDLAYFVESKFSLRTTTLRGQFRNIGSAFYSLGTPYLLNDVRGFDLSGTQRLWANRIYLSGGYDLSRDNLSSLKSATTTAASGYANANITPDSLPSFNVGYRFYIQKNNDVNERLRVDNRSQSLSAGISHRVQLFELIHALSAMYSQTWFRNRSPVASPTSDYDAYTVRISVNTQLKIPVALFGTLGLTKTRQVNIGTSNHRWLYNLSVSNWLFESRLVSSLSFSYDQEKGELSSRYTESREVLSQTVDRNRMSLSLRSDYRMKNQTISFKVERIMYDGGSASTDNYKEFVVQLIFIQRFGI